MPCSQIQNPSENGQVFWNYNASPATVRAREALEKKMRQTEDDKKGRKNENKQIVPSPLQRLPLPTRRKVTSTNEDKSAKESERKREADEMLNSMKQIFQAEIQKHQVPLKTEFGDELNDGKISSSGSSTDRLSDSHLQCSSNSPTPSDGGNDIPTQKSKPANPLKSAHNTNINENVYQKTSASSRYNSPALLHDTLGEGNRSLGIEGLVSDDDSFILKCSQAIDKEYLENNENPSFATPHLVQVNSNREIKDCTSKCASYNTDAKNAHRTNNGKNLLPNSVNISVRSEPIDSLKGHSTRKEQPNKNYQKKIELKVCETFFDSDDDFDTMLSQMEMPEVPKSPIPSNLAIRGISVKGKQADIFKNISSDYHKSSTTSTYKSSNLKVSVLSRNYIFILSAPRRSPAIHLKNACFLL